MTNGYAYFEDGHAEEVLYYYRHSGTIPVELVDFYTQSGKYVFIEGVGIMRDIRYARYRYFVHSTDFKQYSDGKKVIINDSFVDSGIVEIELVGLED